uniref:uncharacterized protein LOC132695160 isoform X1 n=1 Tax=Panthera onca TaxID=9690 RepID=UPI002952CB3F|nr:uncharacterized protein LOC132695160 isoform X1 [Panthera onca]
MTPVNQEGGLTRHGICQHLHLRLAAPRTVRKKYLLFSPRLWCSVTAARAKTLRWFLLPSLLKDVSSYTDFLVHGHFFPSTSVIPRRLSVFSLLLRRSFVFLSGYTEDLYPVLYTVVNLLPESHGWRSRGAGGKLALGCTTAVCNPQRGWLGLALASPGLTLDLICSVACGQTWLSSLASCWCRSPLSPDELCHFPQFWNLTTFSGLLRPWGHRCCRTDLHPLLSQSKWNLVWVF